MAKWCIHEKKLEQGDTYFDVCSLTNGMCTGPEWRVGTYPAACPSFKPTEEYLAGEFNTNMEA